MVQFDELTVAGCRSTKQEVGYFSRHALFKYKIAARGSGREMAEAVVKIYNKQKNNEQFLEAINA